MANSTASADAGASNMTSLEAVLPLNRLVIYAGDVEETAAFYETHFGFKPMRLTGDRIVELVAQDGGANIMLHQAAKGQRRGQSTVKLVFDVENVEILLCRMRRQRPDIRADPQGGRLCLRQCKGPVSELDPGFQPGLPDLTLSTCRSLGPRIFSRTADSGDPARADEWHPHPPLLRAR